MSGIVADKDFSFFSLGNKCYINWNEGCAYEFINPVVTEMHMTAARKRYSVLGTLGGDSFLERKVPVGPEFTLKMQCTDSNFHNKEIKTEDVLGDVENKALLKALYKKL